MSQSCPHRRISLDDHCQRPAAVVAVASVAQAGLSENTYVPGAQVPRHPGTQVPTVAAHVLALAGSAVLLQVLLSRRFAAVVVVVMAVVMSLASLCRPQHVPVPARARGPRSHEPAARAYEAIPAAARHWFGGFTSEIAVVLSMLQDVDGHAHLLPLAPTRSLLLPLAPTYSRPLPLASTGLNTKSPSCPQSGHIPVVAFPEEFGPRSTADGAYGPARSCCRLHCLCLCRFLAAAALLPCLASCNATRAPPRRLDLPAAAAMTPVWLPCPTLPYPT
jgi:hypothetical protein